MALEQSIVEKIKKVNFIDLSKSTYEANRDELINLSKTNKNIMFIHDNTEMVTSFLFVVLNMVVMCSRVLHSMVKLLRH